MDDDVGACAPTGTRATIGGGAVLLRSTLLLGALFAAAAVLGAFFHAQVLAWSARFVDVLGGPGVMLGVLLPDAFPIPIPQDAVLMFGLLGGLGFWKTVVWGGVGSLGGAVIGFAVGRWLGTTRWYAFVIERIGARAHAMVVRYGMLALALSTVAPIIPFGACCWVAGALGARFRFFFLIAQLRWLRVAGYLWLIRAGFVSASPH